MRRGQLLLMIIGAIACASLKPDSGKTGTKEVQLDFEQCLTNNAFKSIDLKVSNGFKLTKHVNRGFCEYRFAYEDGSILYVSSDIYSGSELNYENRLSSGISTYSVNRSENDTIRSGGEEQGGRYWSEQIIGSYTVGFVQVTDSSRFIKTLDTIRLNPANN